MTTGAVLAPALCTPSSCAEYIANVRLPAGSFAPPTGMLVALQWPDDQLDLGYDMDLYVYAPDGSVAGSSTDVQYSSDEAVWIQNPANGRYRIVVVPHGEIGTSPYKVDVQFERGRETQQKSTRAYPNNGNGTDAWQVLYRTDGSYVGRKAGDAVFAPAHGHVHFRGFDHTGLYKIGKNRRPGKLVAKMEDKGRCALDTHNERFGRSGDSPMRYVFPSTCDQNENQDPGDTIYPNAPYFRSGVSPGWNDEYPWFIPDQFIDVAGVPDGRYLIVTRVNGARNVLETNYADNQAIACVKLKGDNPTGCPLP